MFDLVEKRKKGKKGKEDWWCLLEVPIFVEAISELLG
jgi:hypothetical protein